MASLALLGLFLMILFYFRSWSFNTVGMSVSKDHCIILGEAKLPFNATHHAFAPHLATV